MVRQIANASHGSMTASRLGGCGVPAARINSRARISREQMSATERALAESTERYRSLFAYSPHAAFSLDLEGNFTDANTVAEHVSGYTLDDFLHMKFTDVVSPEDVTASVGAFEQALDR